MKGRGSRGVRGVRRSRRGGQAVIDMMSGGPGQVRWFGGGKRTFIKRTCRSKSRCGGAANNRQVFLDWASVGGSRGVRRSRRGGQGVIVPDVALQ